jgi:hypothetical protein
MIGDRVDHLLESVHLGIAQFGRKEVRKVANRKVELEQKENERCRA